MAIEFHEIKREDLSIVKEIYDHYILNTTATFHTSPVPINELQEFIPVGNLKYKSFLIKANSDNCGYCYFSQYKNRVAHDRTAEITIYLKSGFTGKSIGKKVCLFFRKNCKECRNKNPYCCYYI